MTGQQHRPVPVAANGATVIRIALIVALCIFLASIMPKGLILATLSSLLTLAGFSTAFLAAILREPIWPATLTRWDQAALLFALGMTLGWAVDPEALAVALAEGAVTR